MAEILVDGNAFVAEMPFDGGEITVRRRHGKGEKVGVVTPNYTNAFPRQPFRAIGEWDQEGEQFADGYKPPGTCHDTVQDALYAVCSRAATRAEWANSMHIFMEKLERGENNGG